MNEQEEIGSIISNKKEKIRTSESELDVSGELKPKKKVKFRIEEEDPQNTPSKKRKGLGSPDLQNTENESTEIKKKMKKSKTVENQTDEHNVLDFDNHEHIEEPHSNDTIDWPQNDLRSLVTNMERVLPDKDNLAFQTRADKLNWDDIAFGKYTGEDCKKTWFLIQKRIRRFRLLCELLQDAKEWISKPWTHFYKGTKNNRHPDLPKRPLSGYMLFYVKKRDKIVAQNPGLEMTEISKIMAQLYKNISTEKREKYVQLAIAEKKAYEEKLDEFYRLHPDIPRCPERSNHSKAVEVGPKKPSTPFSYFYNHQLKHFHSESEGDRNSFKEQCKEQWKSMSEKKKVVWIDCALDEEDKYQEELKNYLVQNPNYVSTFKSFVSKEERALKERLAGKPIKPPNSAYSFFSQIMLKSEEIKKIDPKSRMKALADQWKMCSDGEKKIYQEHAEQLMVQYKLDFAAYLDSLPEGKRQEELQNNLPKRKTKKIDDSKQKLEEEKSKHELEKAKGEEKKNNTDEIEQEKTETEKEKERIEKEKEKERAEMEKEKEKSEREKEKAEREKEKLKAERQKEKEKAEREKEKEKMDKEREREKEKQKAFDKLKAIEKPKVDEIQIETEPVENTSKKRKKKKETPKENSKTKKLISLTKIFEAQPAHPPQSGFALFSKRYHGKTHVKTAWKNLNKLEKREYEAEVKMLKQKYIKEYETFLKSLNKEQLTAFSQMNKEKNQPNNEQKIKQPSDDEDEEDEEDDYNDEDYNTDNTDF